MEYYFLDGIEKVGPLSIDELKSKEISDDTLIWHDGTKEWRKLKDLPELNQHLHEVETTSALLPKETLIPLQEQKNGLKTALKLIFGIIILGISLYIPFYLVDREKNEIKQEILAKIDLIFQGKISACDGVKYTVDGKLRKLKEPSPKKDDLLGQATYNSDLQVYKYRKSHGVVEEFYLISGGFTVYKIVKEDNGYIISKTESKDMWYYVGEYNYYDDGFGGYKINTYRPSVEECYTNAFKYLTTDNEDGSYTSDIYNKIENFSRLKNDFFSIENVGNPNFHNSPHWANSGDVHTNKYKVLLKHEHTYYEIKENEEVIKELLHKYLVISISIAIILIAIMFWLFKLSEG